MLIIEDGMMPEGANTFATVEEADAYFAARNDSGWPVPFSDLDADPNTPAKEAALIRAADYLNTLQWNGEKVDFDWQLCWPRRGCTVGNASVPEDIVPRLVRTACLELAREFFGGTDILAPQEHGNRVQSETVGPISTTYFDDASAETYFPAVAGLLSQYLRVIPGKGGNTFTTRKVIAG